MANYTTLKEAIQRVIKTNGNEEITGELMQSSLISLINSLGSHYQFVGVATTTTNPGTPDQNVFYVAGPGTYPNFGPATVADGHLGFFKYNGTWTVETVAVGRDYDGIIDDIETAIANINATLGYGIVEEVAGLTADKVIYIRTGELQNKSGDGRGVTDYIPIQPGGPLKIISGVYTPGDSSYVAIGYYSDNAGTYISGYRGTGGQEIVNTEMTVPANAHYIRLYVKMSTPAVVQIGASVKDNIDDIQNRLAQDEDVLTDLTETVAGFADTKETVDALATHQKKTTKRVADFTIRGIYQNGAAAVSSNSQYRAVPLIYVYGGQEIKFVNWQKSDAAALGGVAAIWCYDNDGLPYNGSSARINYRALTTVDLVNGNYTLIVPANCSQIGLSFNFYAYPVGDDGYIEIGEEKYVLTDLAKDLINLAVEGGHEVSGGDSARYYLKGNSNIIYDNTRKLGIIAGGQSNINGRNSYSDFPTEFPNPNPKVLFKKEEAAAFAPFEVVDGGANNDWSFDAIVYNLLTSPNYGNLSEIYVMKHSRGGTSIDPAGATNYHWTVDYEFLSNPGYSELRNFEKVIRSGIASDGENFNIKAFLWHQGEGDMQTEEVASRYYDNLKNMLAYVRGIVGNPRLHVFCGNISLNRTSPGYVNVINAAYTRLASEDPYLHVVDMSRAELEDGYHFNYVWSIYFGQKVYDMMIDAGIISGTKINPVEPS